METHLNERRMAIWMPRISCSNYFIQKLFQHNFNKMNPGDKNSCQSFIQWKIFMKVKFQINRYIFSVCNKTWDCSFFFSEIGLIDLENCCWYNFSRKLTCPKLIFLLWSGTAEFLFHSAMVLIFSGFSNCNANNIFDSCRSSMNVDIVEMIHWVCL